MDDSETPDPESRPSRHQPPLKRIPAQYSFRPVAFYDRHLGRLCGTFGQGRPRDATPDAAAAEMLAWAAHPMLGDSRPHTIYLTGGATAGDTPPRDWWREPLQHGWHITSWRTDPYRVAYERDGLTVEIATAAPWFGGEHDAGLCYRAYIALRAELKRRFRDTHAELLTTPASTGADLFRRSLPLRIIPGTETYNRVPKYQAVDYPPVPDELREIILATQGQGRMECVAPAGGSPQQLHRRETTPGLWVYDARWQYAACVAHLPIGPWTHDHDVPDLAPHRVGWYRVDAWVPNDWQHIGLIGVRSPNDGRRVWPNTPGSVIRDAWVSSAELHVAVNVAGWECDIKERWLAAPDASGPGDIGRRWMEALRELRQDMQATPDCSMSATYAPLVAYAARHLLIDCVGYWWRPERRVAGVAPDVAALPTVAGIGDVLATEDGIEYTVPAPFRPMRAALYRPELAATVWGRSLARTHKRALMVPARDLGWVRSDSVVTFAPQPDWADQGRIGDWRLKASLVAHTPPELPIPRTETAYRALWSAHGVEGSGAE